MPYTLEEIIGIIDSFQTISNEEKRELVMALARGEESAVDRLQEIARQEAEIKDKEITEIDKEIARVDEEIEEEDKKVELQLQQLYKEFVQVCQKELDRFTLEIKQIDKDADKKIEALIKQEGEESEIDAIRQSLQKPK